MCPNILFNIIYIMRTCGYVIGFAVLTYFCARNAYKAVDLADG